MKTDSTGRQLRAFGVPTLRNWYCYTVSDKQEKRVHPALGMRMRGQLVGKSGVKDGTWIRTGPIAGGEGTTVKFLNGLSLNLDEPEAAYRAEIERGQTIEWSDPLRVIDASARDPRLAELIEQVQGAVAARNGTPPAAAVPPSGNRLLALFKAPFALLGRMGGAGRTKSKKGQPPRRGGTPARVGKA